METTNVNPNALKLDVNAQKNFIRFFNSLGEKPASTVRFFDRNDYYSVHGNDDSELISKIISKSTSGIKMMSPTESDRLPYVTLSKANFECAIKELLLVKNYRVEVYMKKSSTNDWKIEYKGSPGNLVQFEDILFDSTNGGGIILGSAVVAIQLRSEANHKTIGLGCADTNDCLLSIIEFVDDDYFTELEAITVLLGPKECLLPSEEDDFARIKTIMERNGVLVSTRKKSEFSIEKSQIVQDLNKLLRFEKGQQKDANTLPEITKNTAISALGAVMKYLDLCNDAGFLGHFQLKLLNLNRFVHLDSAAVSALNILPQRNTNINSPSYRWESILGVLDRCRTIQGHRLMAQWIKQPLRNEATIKDRHDIVACLLDSPETLTDLHDNYLKGIPDLLMLMKKLMRKKATLQDLFRIYQVIIRTPRIVTTFLNLENSCVKSVICDPLKDALDDLKMLKQMVDQVLDLEGIQKGEYLVKASFDDQLQDLKDKMDDILENMEKQFGKAAENLGMDKGGNIKLEFVSHLGYHFRISLKDDTILRKNSKFKILDAVKGGVRFTTDRLSEYNEEFKQIKEQYEEQQKTIVDEVIRVAIGYMGPLTRINEQIAQVDCLVSFAIAARNAPVPYIRPKMHPEGAGILKLKGVRHPCLELQDSVTYIANDVYFKKGEAHMYIITGPNMGGKSTYIRSIGTAVLMAHLGSFVPCEEAEISIVDSILGRIGANDNIMKGLSTFLVEMIETAGIIRTATDKSIVIIDELGRGTSTYEGCGIAWSIAEHLASETKCFTLFATHFHEITKLADYVPAVKNCHVTASVENDNFTLFYQVKPGIMDKSFGVHVAKLANFPSGVVKMAEDVYEQFYDENFHLHSEDNKGVLSEIEESLQKITENKEISDDQLKDVIEDIRKKAINCG